MRECHGQSVTPVADEFDAVIVWTAMRHGAERARDRFNQLGPRFCCDNPKDSAHKIVVVFGEIEGGRRRTNDAFHQRELFPENCSRRIVPGVIERWLSIAEFSKAVNYLRLPFTWELATLIPPRPAS